MNLPFILPAQTPNGLIPKWTGSGFQIGEEVTSILEYSTNNQGWNDELTILHEEMGSEHHFIDRASRQHALQQFRKHVSKEAPIIMEVGCSSGFLLRLLCKEFPDALVIGSDVVQNPLKQLVGRLPGVPLLRFDLVKCPLLENSFDAIILLNVLEHIEDDLTAMQHVYRILKPGGIAIIEVPAGPHLFDAYDTFLKHFRRYTLSSLCDLVKKVNFEIVEKSHLGCLMYLGFSWIKKRNRRLISPEETAKQSHVEENIQKVGSGPFLKAIMQLELALGKAVSYPFGIRCLLTCVKSEN